MFQRIKDHIISNLDSDKDMNLINSIKNSTDITDPVFSGRIDDILLNKLLLIEMKQKIQEHRPSLYRHVDSMIRINDIRDFFLRIHSPIDFENFMTVILENFGIHRIFIADYSQNQDASITFTSNNLDFVNPRS